MTNPDLLRQSQLVCKLCCNILFLKLDISSSSNTGQITYSCRKRKKGKKKRKNGLFFSFFKIKQKLVTKSQKNQNKKVVEVKA